MSPPGSAMLGAAILLAACASTSEPPSDSRKPGDEATSAAASNAAPSSADDVVSPRLLRRFRAIQRPPSTAIETGRAALGRQLFSDPRLSRTGAVSCNSCHDLANYGVDGATVSIGVDGHRGTRNAPTVYNASQSFAQFWDGRAGTLEEQAKGPLTNASEMDMQKDDVEAAIKRIPAYEAAFRTAFPGEEAPVKLDNVASALAAFERTLITPSRWDKYLGGDDKALSHGEKKGLKTFLNSGCMVCHTGVNLGGASYERLGVVEPWPNTADTGRMQVTGVVGDKMMFKVPTLRNVAKTAPYFHDGSAATLEDAVQRMGRHQLGIDLSQEDTASIVAWLGSLTGDLPEGVGR